MCESVLTEFSTGLVVIVVYRSYSEVNLSLRTIYGQLVWEADLEEVLNHVKLEFQNLFDILYQNLAI